MSSLSAGAPPASFVHAPCTLTVLLECSCAWMLISFMKSLSACSRSGPRSLATSTVLTATVASSYVARYTAPYDPSAKGSLSMLRMSEAGISSDLANVARMALVAFIWLSRRRIMADAPRKFA